MRYSPYLYDTQFMIGIELNVCRLQMLVVSLPCSSQLWWGKLAETPHSLADCVRRTCVCVCPYVCGDESRHFQPQAGSLAVASTRYSAWKRSLMSCDCSPHHQVVLLRSCDSHLPRPCVVRTPRTHLREADSAILSPAGGTEGGSCGWGLPLLLHWANPRD